jgi:prepilin-type N-terminal cleavage/methylation domain-containing protein/prepilin-type processing-associated H-X9-DG protein
MSGVRRPRPPGRGAAFSLIELLVVIAIIGILSGLLLPALARAKGKGQQAGCLSNLHQIGMGFTLLLQDEEDQFPDRRDLKNTLGYQPWTTWPTSDPRGGWAPVVLTNAIQADRTWYCPSMNASPLRTAAQSVQESRPGDESSQVSYWLWRFDRPDNPVPLDDFWGKTVEQCIPDLRAAHNPQVGQPAGPEDVEMAVDPYYPMTITSLPSNLRGRALHPGGRNRLFLDTHAEFLRDPRTN